MIYKIILYLSYLSVPIFIFIVFYFSKNYKNIIRKKILLIFIIGLLLSTVIFIYSFFVERNIITVNEVDIEVGFSSKVVVISDLHLGVYKGRGFLKGVVEKINNIQEVDFVVIAGDFTNEPGEDFSELFTPLRDIKYPVYATLGNHDCSHPGPDIRDELEEHLLENNVTLLNNQSVYLVDQNISILGLGDRWSEEDNSSLINSFEDKSNLIVIAHNPDTTADYENNIADLTISGHAHGGQVRIPWIYKYVIPSYEGFDQGFYDSNGVKVYVSSGLGEVGLPLRLGIPPAIDILNLY